MPSEKLTELNRTTSVQANDLLYLVRGTSDFAVDWNSLLESVNDQAANPFQVLKSTYPYGATFDGVTDDSAAFQTWLDNGYSILLPAQSTAVIKNLKFKFHHQGIQGSGGSILKVVDPTADGIQIIGPYATPDPEGGGSANSNFIENLAIDGPGTYTAADGSFSGSTGSGLIGYRKNGMGVNIFCGDFISVRHVQIYGFNYGVNLDGFGNCSFVDIDTEHNNHGFYAGPVTGNGMVINGITSSFNSTDCIQINGGLGWIIEMRDVNADPGSSTVQLAFNGGSITAMGGNFEGIGIGGHQMTIVANVKVTTIGCQLQKTGGGPDVVSVVNNGLWVKINTDVGGFTTPVSGGGQILEIAGKKISIGAPDVGGGFLMSGTRGVSNIDLAFDWERNSVGDWSFLAGSAGNTTPDKKLVYISATANKITVCHNADTVPSQPSSFNVQNGDAEVIATGSGYIVKSPNGSRFRLTVDNAGTLVTTAL